MKAFSGLGPHFFLPAVFILASFLLASGCASTGDTESIRLSLNPKRYKKKADFEKFDSIAAGIVERNRTTEKSPEWLKRAYSGIMLRKLTDVRASEYPDYKKYLKDGSVYMVVHPAYYVFFHNETVLSSKKDRETMPDKNLVERFYERPALLDYKFRILQEQERLLRDFIEVVSSSRKLLIVVLPGTDYTEHMSYGYIEGLDEYARYINEVTNESESVLYVYSESWEFGPLKTADMAKLSELLKAIEPKRIIVGGGYVGRCLQDFYSQLRQHYAQWGVYYAPEITAIAPADMNEPWTNGLLTDDGRINFRAAARNLQSPNAYGIQRIIPDITGIAPYSFYPKKKPE